MKRTKANPAESGQQLASALKAADEMARDAVAKEREWMEAGVDAWSAELARYFDDLAGQTQRTFTQLRACQTPLDVLKVEQEWWTARSKAYLESGLRFAQTFAEATARLGAPEKRFDAL